MRGRTWSQEVSCTYGWALVRRGTARRRTSCLVTLTACGGPRCPDTKTPRNRVRENQATLAAEHDMMAVLPTTTNVVSATAMRRAEHVDRGGRATEFPAVFFPGIPQTSACPGGQKCAGGGRRGSRALSDRRHAYRLAQIHSHPTVLNIRSNSCWISRSAISRVSTRRRRTAPRTR